MILLIKYQNNKYDHVANLFIPSNVLLAISTTPPAGRATTPINPFPIPLKNPLAPSFFAPETQH